MNNGCTVKRFGCPRKAVFKSNPLLLLLELFQLSHWNSSLCQRLPGFAPGALTFFPHNIHTRLSDNYKLSVSVTVGVDWCLWRLEKLPQEKMDLTPDSCVNQIYFRNELWGNCGTEWKPQLCSTGVSVQFASKEGTFNLWFREQCTGLVASIRLFFLYSTVDILLNESKYSSAKQSFYFPLN